MKFKEIIAVTGIPGLKRIVAQRGDGLILSEMNGEGKKFYSNRQHMFSPLENISMYTDDNDTVALYEVLLAMKKQKETHPPVEPNANNELLRNYLGIVLPNFDRDRVNVSDIKKLIKWFHILEEWNALETMHEATDADIIKEEA